MIQSKVQKLPQRDETLPSMEEIVEQRFNAGIAGYAESRLFLEGDIVEDDYDDTMKRRLLTELEEHKQNQKK